MGACSSQPAVASVGDSDVLFDPSEASCKADTTRARRLSVSADAKGQVRPGAPLTAPAAAGAAHGSGPAADSGGSDSDGDMHTGSEQVVRRNSGTRVRRLSFLTNDKGLARRMSESRDGYDGEEGEVGAAPGRRGRGMCVASLSRAGREPGYKKTNQDACFAYDTFLSEGEGLFGAMDGHGPNGHMVSAFVRQNLPTALAEQLAGGAAPPAALSAAFLSVDAGLAASGVDCELSGTTTCVAHLKGAHLTTAWVGDSRAVLARVAADGGAGGGSSGLIAFDLTADHKPTNPGERERILSCNGRVERLMDEMGQPMGPHRVWLPYAWVPGLAMSRALGDQLAHQVGVSSEPDTTQLDITREDAFLIMASDGVWEFISSQEAVDLVAACDTVEEACRTLVDEAYTRWLEEEDGVVDDVTVVIVDLLNGRWRRAARGAAAAGAPPPLAAPAGGPLSSGIASPASLGSRGLRLKGLVEVVA
ncbi:MAG: phosphatase 2C-like domain-containing protein [Monoraphidium minutum]|nr:MAG: phosphatase 2C-like domain-containing protein [Monoraphidium minutum]